MDGVTPAPLLSIVTVVKDDDAGLQRTIDSLQAAGVSEGLEIEWIVQDSSVDQHAVPGALRMSDMSARYEWETPEGVFPAMNSALKRARGNYVWFINAGDRVSSREALQLVLRTLRPLTALWVVGQVAFVSSQGTKTVPKPFDYAIERKHLFARGRFPPHQGTIVGATALRDIGGFDETYTVAGDYEACLRLSYAGIPVVLDAIVAEFYLGGVSQREWFRSVQEFHRARRRVYTLRGRQWIHEWLLTLASLGKHASVRLLRPGQTRLKEPSS
jgi:Glycosyltransferase like family 2